MRGRGIFGFLFWLLRALFRGGRRRPRRISPGPYAGRKAAPKTYGRRSRRG